MNIKIREFQPDDVSFLWDMLYESIHFSEEVKPAQEVLLKDSNINKYLRNWGLTDDHALIAINDNNQRIGAVWIRKFPSDDHGYGYIDKDTPEIGIAILPLYQSKGVGKILLQKMIVLARSLGYPALSLSVDPMNQVAISLYEKFGFKKHWKDTGGSWTMKKDL